MHFRWISLTTMHLRILTFQQFCFDTSQEYLSHKNRLKLGKAETRLFLLFRKKRSIRFAANLKMKARSAKLHQVRTIFAHVFINEVNTYSCHVRYVVRIRTVFARSSNINFAGQWILSETGWCT